MKFKCFMNEEILKKALSQELGKAPVNVMGWRLINLQARGFPGLELIL